VSEMARAKQHETGHSGRFQPLSPSNEAFYTPSAWMTRGITQHAFGVDDTLLLLALATS
jgi:hypothetical protein